jgi:hypothetical protein
LTDSVFHAALDGTWVQFPYDRIVSLESLMDLP